MAEEVKGNISKRKNTVSTELNAHIKNLQGVLDEEIAERKKIPARDLTGQTVEVSEGKIVVAKEGATVVGNIKDRSYDVDDYCMSSVATGKDALATGNSATATGDYATAMGDCSEASGRSSFAAGELPVASGNYAVCLGMESTANGEASVALGRWTAANGEDSLAALGGSTSDNAPFGVAIGEGTHATMPNQVVVGKYNAEEAEEYPLFIVGKGELGRPSNAFTVSKYGSGHFAGEVTVGQGRESLATYNAVLEATKDLTTKDEVEQLIVENKLLKKEDIFSAEDINADTPPELSVFPIEVKQIFESGDKLGWNVSFGDKGSNDVSGLSCIVGGAGCQATMDCCFAWGAYARALAHNAFAFGFEPLASGEHSIAIGSVPEATAPYAVAIGNSVQAKSENQWVRGAYNIPDSDGVYLDIVGNGTWDKLSNAYTLDKDGNGWFAGDVTVGENKDVLATQAYVEETVGDIEALLGGI